MWLGKLKLVALNAVVLLFLLATATDLQMLPGFVGQALAQVGSSSGGSHASFPSSIANVPEPGTFALLATAIAGASLLARRRRKRG